MSFYDNYQFFCVLIFILMPAMLLGILEQPLKWYSTAATFLFTALAFLSKPQQAAWLALFFVTELFWLRDIWPSGCLAGEVPLFTDLCCS